MTKAQDTKEIKDEKKSKKFTDALKCMSQEEWSKKIDEICHEIEFNCRTPKNACAVCDIDHKDFLFIKNKHKKFRKKIDKAMADGAQSLITEEFKKSEKGKIFLLSRVYHTNYGKLKEEQQNLEISEELRHTIQSKDIDIEDKLDAVNQALLTNTIKKYDYDIIMHMLKLRHAHYFKAVDQKIVFDFDKMLDHIDDDKKLKL